jgi:hypothetical protein
MKAKEMDLYLWFNLIFDRIEEVKKKKNEKIMMVCEQQQFIHIYIK